MTHTLTLVCRSSAAVARLRQVLTTIPGLWSIGARGGPDGSASYQFGAFDAEPIAALHAAWAANPPRLVTYEACPECSTPAACEHGVLVNGRLSHIWTCPECGELCAVVCYECEACHAS